MQQAKPNHQITGYVEAASRCLNLEITETVWDCAFLSSRKADMGKAIKDRFWMWGIDIEKDFARPITSRSEQDRDEWLADTIDDAREYAQWRLSREYADRAHWPRNTGACHSYGGCDFRGACRLRGAQEYLDAMFIRQEWNPIKRIQEGRR